MWCHVPRGAHHVRTWSAVAHDAQRTDRPTPDRPPSLRGRRLVEMIIGLALIVIAGLLIVGIVRTVQANMGKG